MALPSRKTQKAPVGSATPRIAPPRPARTKVELFHETCRTIGIVPYPWQDIAARYLYAIGPGDRWLFGENCDVVSRQQGKTEILVPHITTRLRMGRRIMHTAQDRELPREVFGRVADVMLEHYPELLARKPRFANGQEEIRTVNGGRYRIVAPTRSGARGPSNDDVILDEVREQPDFDFIAASEPTLTASDNPQYLYLSNAGEDDSVVLNALRSRAETDPNLAYLEWSAAPDLDAGDLKGWLQANPSIGHNPRMLEYLETQYRKHKLQGTMAIFETEHLCRWVSTMRERLVDEFAWVACKRLLAKIQRPVIAVSMSPEGSRASVAIAWRQGAAVSMRLLYDVTGNPIDTDRLGEDVRKTARNLGVRQWGHDPLTDRELVKYAPKGQAKAIGGQEFANASAQFVNLVVARQLGWDEADTVTSDLTWTARKPTGDSGSSFRAVRAQDDRPITASLAAIRAVWLASGPQPGKPRVM